MKFIEIHNFSPPHWLKSSIFQSFMHPIPPETPRCAVPRGPSSLRWHAVLWLRRPPEARGRHRVHGAGGRPEKK